MGVENQHTPLKEDFQDGGSPTTPAPASNMRATMKGRMTRMQSIFQGNSGSENVEGEEHGEEQEKHAPKQKQMFVDANDMKKKLRDNIKKERYDVSSLYDKKSFCAKVAMNNVFENTTLAVIAFNALWISIDADLNHSDVLIEADPVFIVAENFFCLYFTLEISFRFGAFALKYKCLTDAWFVFDSIMVCLMIFETWVMSIILLAAGGGGGVNLGSTAMIKMLRLLRLSRMARMARLLRSMPEILILIKGMVAAVRSVVFTLMLLVILLYIFAVIFKQLAADTTIGDHYFATVPRSMNQLMINGIFFDSFGTMVDLIIEEDLNFVFLTLLYVFVLLASLTVMNMLIGVLCEVVSAVAETEHEQLTINYLKDSLWDIVKEHLGEKLNTDGNLEDQQGKVQISKRFFMELIQDDKLVVLLKEVEIDVVALVDLVDTIFSTDSGEDKSILFTDFVVVMLDHRSTFEATVKDITDLRRYVRSRIDRMDTDTATRIRTMQAHVNAMSTIMEKLAGVSNGQIEIDAREEYKKLQKEHERKMRAAAKATTGSKSKQRPSQATVKTYKTTQSGLSNADRATE